MADQSAAEAKQQAIDAMGKDLGVQYAEFWQELAQLNITWSEFMELYGTKKSRIELMNPRVKQWTAPRLAKIRKRWSRHSSKPWIRSKAAMPLKP